MRHSGLWTDLSVETVSTFDADSDNVGDRMPSRLGSSRNRNTVVGTPYYMSPEVLRKDDYDETVDWWAFGVLAYECTLGKYPFQGKTALDLFRQIRRAQPNLSELRSTLVTLCSNVIFHPALPLQ
jgi:serine/threonine protein kinase